ncbi:tRNA-dihydrouridine(20) synthase [NAD(P)+]-like [Xenia sp. Carnegie-2017]|uniref:tRNA-dihydrouridine(20) synthase [NAD(P)+]-like n=1 Tax=Xenia sp. Carnegie-2017 TaxID=2897299 RepID=UPI001F04A20A|nr:tRNA-dihydrouridine(20) synthase [NAD(P)+]-like [Xenia sp. Carnegie-2017]
MNGTENKISYKNKKILAPMVRIGGLPMRLLALKYGADLVYCEEIIDHRFLRCTRVENALLQTIDYVHADGNVVFRTCNREKDKLVFQMGTSDPKRALLAAKMVEQDVSAIDVNMGCPKDYSIKGGMGAALLKDPEKVRQILTALVEGISIPVTCKIRILPTIEETLHLVRVIESTKVSAIAVHGREQHERPRHPVHKDIIHRVAKELNISVISNGGSADIINYEDMDRFQEETGTDSVMVARAAQWNPSVFRKEGPLPIDTVIKDFIKFAVEYDNSFSNTKYCLAQMMHEVLESSKGIALKHSRTMKELCDIWNLGGFLKQCEDKRQKSAENLEKVGFLYGKRKREDDVNEMQVTYKRKHYGNMTPKCILYAYTKKQGMKQPYYESIANEERVYKSVVCVNNEKYTSTIGDKNRRSAEQLAALVCLKYLGVDDMRVRC